MTYSTNRDLQIIEMQGPNDISRSRKEDTQLATISIGISLAALLIPLLVCGIFWMTMRCILRLREEYFSDKENKQYEGGGQRCSSVGIA